MGKSRRSSQASQKSTNTSQSRKDKEAMTASLRRERAKEKEKKRKVDIVVEGRNEEDGRDDEGDDEGADDGRDDEIVGEGDGLGASVRVGEGVGDGADEGVGDGVGDIVGDGDGADEGAGEGLGEGAGEGAIVRVGEGVGEGAGEGASVGVGEGAGVVVAEGAGEDIDVMPVNTTILKSFETHIAFAIWNDYEERGPLKCLSHTTKLKEWKINDMPSPVARKIKNSGLYTLAQYSYKHVDYVTISAFIERWHPETNSFHLPFGEMTITLDDVAQILKIPVVGSCIYAEDDDRPPTQLLVDFLGIDGAVAKKELNDSASVKLSFLLETFEEKANKEGATEDDYVVVGRAYMLFLLGCTLFCDKSGTKVPLQFLRCLENTDRLSEHAWGMGALAFLYRQLGLASRRDVKQMAGYLTLLTAWIYDHFPMLPNAIPNKDYDETMPRMCRWQPVKQSGDTTSAIIRLREQLDDLSAQDVCWNPYHAVRSNYPLPGAAFYNGVILCFDIAEPYYPNRVLRQFSIAQRIPTNPMVPTKCRRGLNANQYKVVFDNGFWYSQNWDDHVLSVKSRSTLVVDPWDCTAKYMPWYLKVSHPVVQNPKARISCSKKVDNNDKLRIAAGKAVEILKDNIKATQPRTVNRCLNVEREAVDLLEEALNEPDKREKCAKRKNDTRV